MADELILTDNMSFDEADIQPYFNSTNDPLTIEDQTRPSVKTAEDRAQVYHYAAGKESPGHEAILGDVLAGREQRLRESMAAKEQIRRLTDSQTNAQSFLDSKAGQALTVEDVKHLHQLNSRVVTPGAAPNPNIFFEEKYAQQVLREATKYNNDGDDRPYVFESGLDQFEFDNQLDNIAKTLPKESDEPQVTDGAFKAGKQFITRSLVLHKAAQDILDRYAQEGYGTAALGIAKQLVPGYRWWNFRDKLTDTPGFGDLSGNLMTQINELYSSKYTPDEIQQKVVTALEETYRYNPTLAAELAEKIQSYTDSDNLLDNVIGGLDVAVFAGISKPVFTRLMKSASRTTTIAGIRDLTGATAEAALRDVRDQALKAAQAAGQSKDSLNNVFGVVQALTNPRAVLIDASSTRFSTGAAANFADMMNNYGTGLLKSALLDPLNVTRTPTGTETFKAMAMEGEALLKRVYPRTNQNIMSIEVKRSIEDTVTNLDMVQARVGGPGAIAFGAPFQAKRAARQMGLKEYQVVQHGVDDYALLVNVPVDETLPTIKHAMQKDLVDAVAPDTTSSAAINFFRTKDKFVAQGVNQDLKVTAGGVQKLQTLSKNILSKEVGELRRSDSKALEKFLIHQQDNNYWSNTIGKFEADWINFNGTFPTERQFRAYIAMQQVNASEYLMSNIRATTMKSREGLMNHRLKLPGIAAKDMPWVEARVIERVPWELGDDAGILVWPNKTGEGFQYGRKVFTVQKSQNAMSRDGVDELVKVLGYRVLNVSRYGQEALRELAKNQGLKEFPKGRVDYLIVKSMETKPLGFEHIPFKPGGHYFYRDPFFISQAKVVTSKFPGGERSDDYLGDTHWFSARTKAEAVEMAGHMEAIRQLLVAGNKAGAKAYAAKHVPMSYKDIALAFNPKKGFLDLGTPIHWRTAEDSIEDVHKISGGYKNFSDFDKSTHNVLNDNVKFRYGQERGARLSGIYNVGSQEHPVWKMEPSRLLDPYNAVRRGTNTMNAARFTDDLRIKTATQYVNEFASVLNKPADELNRFPLRSLMDVSLINKTHVDKELVAKAQNYRRAVLEFLQDEPIDVTRGNYLKEKALGIITGADRQEWAINKIDRLLATDPKAFLRYWAGFVPNMGLWNPKQLFMQAQGMTVTASIEGWARTTSAAGIGWDMRAAMINGDPKVINELALRAYKNWGIKPKDFKASMEGLQKTDFWRVGDNWADVNDLLGASSISTARNIADSSLYFFNKGERANKITAWNASFIRWREANPVKPFKGQAVKEVLEYADFLTMNMTRASSAANQAGGKGLMGWTSVATQFWSYQTRLMDMMLGKTLTPWQKLKFMGYQSMLYGVPIGTLGTSFGAFFQPSNALRKFAEYEGWDISDPVSQALMNGIPQTLYNIATGADQNIAQTMGPNGLSVLPELLAAFPLTPEPVKVLFGAQGKEGKDADLLTILTGAAGTKIKAAIDASSPLAGVLINTIVPGYGKPYTVHDLVDALQVAGVTNNAVKAWYAYNIGAYYTKQGKTLMAPGSLDGWDAASMFLLGSMPQDVSNFYGSVENDKSRQEAQSLAKQQAIEAFQRSTYKDLSDEDIMKEIDTANKWMALGDFTLEQRADILRDAYGPKLDAMQSLENKINNGSQTAYDRWLNKATEGNR